MSHFYALYSTAHLTFCCVPHDFKLAQRHIERHGIIAFLFLQLDTQKKTFLAFCGTLLAMTHTFKSIYIYILYSYILYMFRSLSL